MSERRKIVDKKTGKKPNPPPKKKKGKKKGKKEEIDLTPEHPDKYFLTKKEMWWRDQVFRQYYSDEFFSDLFNKYQLPIPEDYKDPLKDEEDDLMLQATPDFRSPSNANLNIGNLFKHYTDNIIKQHKDWLVAILIPTGTSMIDIDTSTTKSTMYKPKHRIHTVKGHNIHILRNQLVEMGLRFRDTTHFLFLDSDVIPPPFGLIRLMRRDVPIVSGLYLMRTPPYAPLIIKRPQRKDGSRKFNFYPELTDQHLGKCFEVDGIGAGFLLVKREVFERVDPPWFDVKLQEYGLSAIGEDLCFCDKMQDHGYKIVADLSVQCEHTHGGVSFPRVFFDDFLRPGGASAHMINSWNKNAVLWAEEMPLYKSKKEIEEEKELEAIKQGTLYPASSDDVMPLEVEKEEQTGDARSIKKQ